MLIPWRRSTSSEYVLASALVLLLVLHVALALAFPLPFLSVSNNNNIIIIISLFQEDNIFGTNASLTYGPRFTKVEMTLAIEHA